MRAWFSLWKVDYLVFIQRKNSWFWLMEYRFVTYVKIRNSNSATNNAIGIMFHSRHSVKISLFCELTRYVSNSLISLIWSIFNEVVFLETTRPSSSRLHAEHFIIRLVIWHNNMGKKEEGIKTRENCSLLVSVFFIFPIWIWLVMESAAS